VCIITSLCLRLCSKLQIQSKMDSAYLLESLAGNFMDVVQYNEDNRAFEVCELEISPDTRHYDHKRKSEMVRAHEDSGLGSKSQESSSQKQD